MSHPKYKNIGSPATRLIEELSEVIQTVCKGQRFGWDKFHPDRDCIFNNAQALDAEMEDVLNAYLDLKKEIRENE